QSTLSTTLTQTHTHTQTQTQPLAEAPAPAPAPAQAQAEVDAKNAAADVQETREIATFEVLRSDLKDARVARDVAIDRVRVITAARDYLTRLSAIGGRDDDPSIAAAMDQLAARLQDLARVFDAGPNKAPRFFLMSLIPDLSRGRTENLL